MKKRVVQVLALLAVMAFGVVAQEPKPKPDAKPDALTPSVTPLRVQVVFSEYDGEKKVSSLPYTFTVNADERRARPGSLIRSGARLPVITAKDQLTYVDIGTNVDCSATLQEDGRYKLQMALERSSVSSESSGGSGTPVIRQFRVDLNPVLKDGQTVESVASTDPLTGHVYHVSVTLNVLK
jgi:hypothetical protein